MIKQPLGLLLRRYRKNKGWTQEKTALEAEVSFRFLQEIEGGKQQPSLMIIFKLCKALEVTPEQLINPIWLDWLEHTNKSKK